MVPPAATDVDPDTLRRSGHWALFWELVHARGAAAAVEAAWADLADHELPGAQAGYEAARRARQARFSARARAKATRRLSTGSAEHTDDPLALAHEIVNERSANAR